MTRTTQVLKRLGVAGVVAATIGAGVPALVGIAAQAATAGPATTISVSPTTQSAGTGTCQVFTVTVKDASANPATGTVTVQISDPSAATDTADPTATSAAFCSVTLGNEPAVTPPTGTTTSGHKYLTFQATNGTATFGVNDTEAETVGVTTFLDQNGDGNFQPATDTAANNVTAKFTAGNTNATGAPTQTANDSVAKITDKSTSTTGDISVLLTNAAGDVVTGATPTLQYKAGSANGGATATAAGPNQSTCAPSDNSGISTCTVNQPNGGTDTIIVFVNQSPPNGQTPGPDANEPQITLTRTAPSPASAATTVTLTPNGSTFAAGSSIRYTATVTDAHGNPVTGIAVVFSSTGAGGSQGGNSTTDNSGRASFIVYTASNDSGTQTVTATISTGSTACNVGSPPAGCSAKATNTIGAASPSPSASSTASPAPSGSPSGTPGGRGSLDTTTPDIQPNIQGVLDASGLTGGAVYELRCYSRPSTSYFTARTATVASGSSTLEFRILPGTNTRCYVRPAGNDAAASNSVVINVHTTLSLSTVYRGGRTFTFQGRNLPRRSGQLITLYRVANGQEIRTSNLTTDASGIYRLDRTFTGRGTFDFLVRTSQTLTNAPGKSNVITVTIP